MRVLVVSADRVGRGMAGPAIRAYRLAAELAKRFDVTLAVPFEAGIPGHGFDLVVQNAAGSAFRRLATGFDAVFAQPPGLRTLVALGRADVRTVYDLYVPSMMENLGFHGGQDDPHRRQLAYQATNALYEVALVTGDAFVCASERQRDLWLGALSAVGRVDLDTYARDESFRSLIDVVPFGLDPEPPRKTRAVLKGVVPGIRATDRVLLWAGGIWNWFDPLTLIRAVARIADRRDDVKLYFLGVRHPNPVIEPMAMATRAVELADELGVRDRHVFFNFGWVPYDDRHEYLLEADLGVSTHFDNVETRYAFRTRMLDHFWAGLPSVVTRGDVLAELVERRGLGRVVDYEDVEGLAAAVEGLLDDADELRATRERVEAVREEFAWPRVAQPLLRLVEGGGVRRAARAGAAGVALDHLLLGNSILRRRGPTGLVRDLGRMLRQNRSRAP